MPFVNEDVPDSGPINLAEEHRRLVDWMKVSRAGVIEYLSERMVDPELPAALYYIEGIGMGDGQRFALVRGDAIYLVSVVRDRKKPGAGSPTGCVREVSLPESAPMSRDSIERLLGDALGDYYQAHPYMQMAFRMGTETATFDWSGARWVVRPRKHSFLYWRTRCTRGWREFRERLWPRIWGAVSSPLAASLILATFAWTGDRWAMVLAGVWLALRLLQYETDLRISAWMLGRVKYRHPLGHLQVMGRVMNPQPLAALKVRVEPIAGEPMIRLVRVINRSWLPVPYVSVGAHSLARLLAPGLVDQVRRMDRQGFADSKEVERHFPGMVKKWLWPGQSFASRHHLLADYPLSMQQRHVEAVVAISRLLSGEPRGGAATFLLDVEESSL